jgi:hypothetical protein
MRKALKGSFKQLGLRSHHLGAGFFVTVLIFGVALGFANLNNTPATHAFASPTTPAVPICGLRQNSDLGSYGGVATTFQHNGNNIPAYPQLTETFPNTAAMQIITIKGSQYLYDLNATSYPNYQITIFNLTTPSMTPISFPVGNFGNFYDSFALDPSGGVYVALNTSSPAGQAETLTKYVTTDSNGNIMTSGAGAVGWQKTGQDAHGAAYGYLDTNNQFNVAYLDTQTGSKNYNQTGTSKVFKTDGTPEANNAMDVVEGAYQDSTTGDILSTDNGMLRVYKNDGTIKFQMGTDSGASGTFNINGATSAVENPSGGYFVMVPNVGLDAFNSAGAYLGLAPASSDGSKNNSIGYNVNAMTEYNGVVYYGAQGLDAFDSTYSVNGIYSITPAQMTTLTSYPAGAPSQLGVGAGITTPQTANYFPAGTTASAALTFYPWWQNVAGDYTGQYEVSNASQIMAGVTGPTQTFNIPTASSAYSNGSAPASQAISVPTAPGIYTVSVQLLQNGTVTAASCLVYTVAASNDSFNYNSIPSGNDASGVAVTQSFGQKLYRSSYNIAACFDTSQTPTASSPILATCQPGGGVYNDISAAATEAAQDGITYEMQLGVPGDSNTSAFYTAAINTSGVFQGLIQTVMTNLSQIKTWECWNEPDNNTFSNATDYVNRGLKQCWNAKQAVAPSDKMVGISIDQANLGIVQQYVGAGALNYLDIVAIHPYTNNGQTFEAEGAVMPNIYDTSGETGILQGIQSYLSGQGYTGPLYDTESGFVNNEGAPDPYEYFDQGDKVVRKMILEQSIGMNWWANFNVGYIQGLGQFSLLPAGGVDGTYNGSLTPGALAAINYEGNLGGRTFKNWLSTGGVPYTYAADYGPSSGSTADVVAVWSQDFTVGVVPRLSGGGAMTVTSEYGNTSSLNSGSSLNLTGQVQYITVPAGQTLTLGAQETFGTNKALSSAGATATASSSYCGHVSTDPAIVLQGKNDQGGAYICDSSHSGWAGAINDNNPEITIKLGSAPQNIDRVFIATFGLGAASAALRDYTIEVNPSCSGGTFSTVATVSDQFFNRNNLVSFASQSVCQIEITGITANYTGVNGGIPPTWWVPSQSSIGAPILNVEAYASGTQAQTVAPTVSITSPAAGGDAHTTTSITASATDNSGSGIQKVEFYANGTLLGSDTSSPYTYAWNTLSSTLPIADGSVNLTAKAYDNNGDTTISAPVSVTVNNGDANNSNTVDLSDLRALANNYNVTSGATYAQGDFNADSAVNLSDLRILGNNYGWIGQ